MRHMYMHRSHDLKVCMRKMNSTYHMMLTSGLIPFCLGVLKIYEGGCGLLSRYNQRLLDESTEGRRRMRGEERSGEREGGEEWREERSGGRGGVEGGEGGGRGVEKG